MPIKKLTTNQRLFCQGYIENGGNGVEAVLYAGYKVTNNDRTVASAIAYENLRKPHIAEYMKELYKTHGLSEFKVQKEHSYLIEQNKDLSAKIKAIELYYRVTGQLEKTVQSNLSSNFELEDAIAKIQNLIPN